MALDPQHIESYDETSAPVADPLSFIRPRVRENISAQHSRVVKILRWVLPAGALLVMLALFVWPMVATDKIAAIAMKNIPDLVIKNLHFTGLDSKNEPYS